VIVDEGWRSGSLAGEIAARIQEHAFFSLDAPVARVCSAEVPLPYPRHLELAATPQAESIVAACKQVLAPMSEFRMPSLGADMEAGTLVEWDEAAGRPVERGRSDRRRGDPEGRDRDRELRKRHSEKILVEVGQRVPVGTAACDDRG